MSTRPGSKAKRARQENALKRLEKDWATWSKLDSPKQQEVLKHLANEINNLESKLGR